MSRFVVVTPNPAIDITYRVDRQRIGETLRVRDVHRAPGGKGLNVAGVLAALGRDVVTIQPLGGESGRWMRSAIARRGLRAIDCGVAGETRSTVTVVDAHAHPTVLAEPGNALAADEWARLEHALTSATRPGDWVVIAGSFPPGADPGEVGRLVVAAHARRARVLVDTSGPALRAALAEDAEVVKANESELIEATGQPDARAALRALARPGTSIMLSRGADGALLRLPDGTTHETPAVPGVRGNPTGAGDAATAGLVAALDDGRDARTALSWAAVCGAAAVLSAVAGEIDVAGLPGLAARLPSPPNLAGLAQLEGSRP